MANILRSPFGTRVMVVRDPKPRNAFVPRAEPATVFGVCSSVPNGYWCYQHGHVRVRTNIAVGGLAEEDLVWVKASMDVWDPPDAPLPLPAPELFDAASLTPIKNSKRPSDPRHCYMSCLCFNKAEDEA